MIVISQEKLNAYAYKLYLKMPLGIRNIARKIKNKTQKKIPLANSLNQSTIEFINQLLRFIDKDNSIFYVQPTVMNFTGTDCYNGGAERYVLDLSKLCIDLGYNFYCIQYSSANPWVRHYYGLTIIGLPSFINHVQFQKYIELLTHDAALIISSPFTFVKRGRAKNIIGISHGIYWDTNTYNNNAQLFAREIKYLDKLVSVDTATINFIRSHHVSEIHKISFIPNYVAHENFTSDSSSQKKDREELVILYPRRLYAPRGFWVVHDVIPKILEEFDQVSFLFCGKGDEAEIKAVKKLISRYDNKVNYMIAQPHEMPAIYKKSDIVLVPTIHSEGTSFSVIEAMACKKAIISTYVGGLVDLITDHFTGLMIAPNNKAELYAAIKKLILDKELREYIIENAYKKSLVFNLKIWKKNWHNTIDALLNNPNTSDKKYKDNNLLSNFSLLHLHAEGIHFDEMMQRPQQLFTSLSEIGVNCMFIEDKSGNYQRFINNNLVLAGKETEIDFSGYISYSYSAYHYKLIKKNKPHRLIYDVLDSPDIHASEIYLQYHALMLNAAHIILTSSQLLFNEYENLFPDKIIRYVPNAANPNIAKTIKDAKPIDFPKYSNKTIGFYGALAEWFDFALLEKICARFTNCQIVLLGPCRKNFPEYKSLTKLLKNNPNLFYLGVKKFTELPNYTHHFNVAIIPFLYNSITENCSPVKLFEYMNYSAPIITTNMPECRQYQSALTAKNDKEFLSLIEDAFKIPENHEYFHIMKKEANENTWDHRSKIIIEAIYESLNTH